MNNEVLNAQQTHIYALQGILTKYQNDPQYADNVDYLAREINRLQYLHDVATGLIK